MSEGSTSNKKPGEMPAITHASVVQAEREALGLDEQETVSALSISGGGIRSATFALGVLEGLAGIRLLTRLDYLSTVSGGGYIGSWLTAWRHRVRNEGGLQKVEDQLAERDPAVTGEPTEVRHLRAYSNYLTPKVGAMSFDFWAILTSVLRNMVLNWMVVIPVIMAVLIIPRLYIGSIAFPEFYDDTGLRYEILSDRTVRVWPKNTFPESDLICEILPRKTPGGMDKCSAGCSPNVCEPGHTELVGLSNLVTAPILLSEEEWDTVFYGQVGMEKYYESFFIKWVLPFVSMALFALALGNVFRFLPSVGGIEHRPVDYLTQVLMPLVAGIWVLDIWNNVYYLGENLIQSQPGTFEFGFVVTFSLTLAYVLLRGVRIPFTRTGALVLLGMAVATAVPAVCTWLIYNLVLWQPDGDDMRWYWAQYASYSMPLVMLSVGLSIMLLVGLTSSSLREADREWLARANGGILLTAFCWLVLSVAVLLVPIGVFALADMLESSQATLSSILAGAGGVLGWFISAEAKKNSEQEAGPLAKMVMPVASGVFFALLIVVLALLTNWLLEFAHYLFAFYGAEQCSTLTDRHWIAACERYVWQDHLQVLKGSNPFIVLGLGVFLYGLGQVFGHFVNTNVFSLQGMYRNRLVRAYLGASNPRRKPNPFTGFDDADDMRIADINPASRPYHIVNLTLNLVSGERLDWQQRKGASFIASPLYCGNQDLGYRPSAVYGGGMSLGTAVATSGAAASPNMGYHSSPVTTFLMALFNARLGIWLGNPAREAWKRGSPHSAVASLASEGLGLTSEKSKFVYLSDGGHFENLALYEMIERQCSHIVVLDGGCDPDRTFEDLGNALRKIRIDKGAEIEFGKGQVEAVGSQQKRCALADIEYSDGKKGRLLYIKPVITGTESPDIRSYLAKSPTFPHETTADQWFDESQTESYRELGKTTIEEISGAFTGGSLEDWFNEIEKNYLKE
ncbi:MAG: patatin-like phospholipase family protein [Pseudomonadota bacterium]